MSVEGWVVMKSHEEALSVGGSDGEEAVQEWQSKFVQYNYRYN